MKRATLSTWAARVALCAACVATCAPALAEVDRDGAAQAATRGSAPGSRVLSVERTESSGRPAWRVKLLTPSGEVRVVLVDLATGKPL